MPKFSHTSLTLRRSGEFQIRTTGKHHCGLVNPMWMHYNVKVVCKTHLDRRGFLFDQVTVDEFFQRQKSTTLSCEKLCIKLAHELWELVMQENALCEVLSMELTLSPFPHAASVEHGAIDCPDTVHRVIAHLLAGEGHRVCRLTRHQYPVLRRVGGHGVVSCVLNSYVMHASPQPDPPASTVSADRLPMDEIRDSFRGNPSAHRVNPWTLGECGATSLSRAGQRRGQSRFCDSCGCAGGDSSTRT